MLQKVYSEKITREGYEVDLARDGEEGLNKALNASPDLVLLDIVLPKMNGFYLLSNLRRNPRTQKTPVIILTDRGQEEDIERGLMIGADDYIVKAFATPYHVVEKIQKHLKIKTLSEDMAASLARYRINIQTTRSDAPHTSQGISPLIIFIFVSPVKPLWYWN